MVNLSRDLLPLEDALAFERIMDWNNAAYDRWASMTDAERKRATTFTRQEWQKKTAGCVRSSRAELTDADG